MSVLQQTVSLAAQLRAFSSLLSLPSQAQSVIKAFRRQGIGSADVSNTARFLLSRLESLSALLQVFQIFRGRAELAASRPMARLCALFRCAPQIPQTRLTLASALRRWWFLVTVCACGGKTLISRLNLFPSATCRGLRPCLLWHLWPVSASALQTRKPSPNTIGPPTFARLCVTASLTATSRSKVCAWFISMAKGCILRLPPPDAFVVQIMFRNLLYDICLLCGMDMLKTCNRLAWSLNSSILCLGLFLILCFLIVGRRWVM